MSYSEDAPTHDELMTWPGLHLVEFGADWCGFCQALQPEVERMLSGRSDLRHLKIADGKGRPLGRAFRVKLWPNFVMLRDGEVLWQLARPSAEELRTHLES